MLWHRQAMFKSIGNKLCSSAEGRIWTRGPRHQIASRLNAGWQTDWAIEDRAKNLNSTARPYDQRGFSPLDPTVSWLSHLALAIYIHFSHHLIQRKPLVSNPGMHHGTCVTHVPWCISGSLTRVGGENVTGIPGACANRNFTYLARGPWGRNILFVGVHIWIVYIHNQNVDFGISVTMVKHPSIIINPH